MIKLKILSGGKKGEVVECELPVILLGREPSCTVQLDPYQDRLVHGQHAKIVYRSGEYFLEDLQTKNGVWIDSHQLTSACKLQPGMVFQLGAEGPSILIETCSPPAATAKSPNLAEFSLQNKQGGEKRCFRKVPLRIGRQPDCEFPLDPVKEREVSGYHAVILWEDGQFVIEDLNSANGTFVNGQRIQKIALSTPCTIQLGKNGPELVFALEQSSKKEPGVNNKGTTKKSRKRVRELIQKARHRDQHQYLVKLYQQLQTLWQRTWQVGRSHWPLVSSFLYSQRRVLIPSAVGILLLVGCLVMFFSARALTPGEIYQKYGSQVAVVYCRYLVQIDEELYRGESFGCGLWKDKGEIRELVTLGDNVYPWKKVHNQAEKVIRHLVAVWPSDQALFLHSSQLSYRHLNFPASFNNQFSRLGGKGGLVLPGTGKKKSSDTMHLVVHNESQTSLPELPSWESACQLPQDNKVYLLTYSLPISLTDNGQVALHVAEVQLENDKIFSHIPISGAPLFNKYGQVFGLSLRQVTMPGTYTSIIEK